MQAQLQTLARFAAFAAGELLEARSLLSRGFQWEAVLNGGKSPTGLLPAKSGTGSVPAQLESYLLRAACGLANRRWEHISEIPISQHPTCGRSQHSPSALGVGWWGGRRSHWPFL